MQDRSRGPFPGNARNLEWTHLVACCGFRSGALVLVQHEWKGISMSILNRFSLSGKIALVTAGAGPLFGKSISEALVEARATLITSSRSAERNAVFAEEMRRKGYDVHGATVDITDAGSIENLRNY